MYGTCVFHMIAAITTNITTIVEIDFHSTSVLVSTYMKAMASYANILRILTLVPPPKDVCVGVYMIV